MGRRRLTLYTEGRYRQVFDTETGQRMDRWTGLPMGMGAEDAKCEVDKDMLEWVWGWEEWGEIQTERTIWEVPKTKQTKKTKQAFLDKV